MSSPKSYNGSCFCGAVQITVTGEPVSMGFCHCDSCRHWSASPVNAFTLWQPESVKITQGEENVGTYNKTPQSYRKWCKICGGHIFTEHPGLGLTDVYAAVIPDVPFIPGLHVNDGDEASYSGRPYETQGFPEGIWWFRHRVAGIVSSN